MENSCRKNLKQSSKKWVLASVYPKFRRNSCLRSTNADLYSYGANNPVRYIDPDGREDTLSDFEYQKRTNNSSYKKEQWTATENLVLTGMDMRFCRSGMTMLHGHADVKFSNGKKSFSKRFEVISIYSEGLFFSIGTSSTDTVYKKKFNEYATKEEIIESYEGIFATQGVSISFPKVPISISYGETVGIDEKTHDVAENGWKGITQGRAIGWGTGANLPKNYSLNIGTQITVYRDPDNPLHSYSSKSDWFFYKPYISK